MGHHKGGEAPAKKRDSENIRKTKRESVRNRIPKIPLPGVLAENDTEENEAVVVAVADKTIPERLKIGQCKVSYIKST